MVLKLRSILVAASFLVVCTAAHAMELDWSGQFWSEFNYIHNYTMDSSDLGKTVDPTRLNPAQAAGSNPSTWPTGVKPSGYYIPGGGSNSSAFETLFLRLNPKVVVNDNVYLKSEFWVGNPSTSVFGGAYPYTFDQRQYYSTNSRGSVITAQRFWGEFLTDFGTVQVGRAPLNWGLGVVWNSGDNLYDRYQSTGDMIRLVSKFGSFTFSPAFINYSTGNALGGACAYNSATGICQPQLGSGSVSDYSILLKYESLEDDFEGGVNFIRRIIGGSQDPNAGVAGQSIGLSAMAFNTWDLYVKKKLGRITLGAEAPIVSGSTGTPYSTFAIAAEADWKISEMWRTGLKLGHAPGQQDTFGSTLDSYKAFYFNPNYQIGTILFNYQLANLGGFPGPNTQNNPNVAAQNLSSPYDNPIVNANYISWTGALTADKWTFNTGVLYARAPQTAKNGQYYFNTWQRNLVLATADQGSSLGVEWDTGAKFQWDDNFEFRWDVAFLFPGNYFKFSNTATENATNTVFASIWRIGVKF